MIRYGGKWGWKHSTGIVQKLYPDLDTAIHYCSQIAMGLNSKLYVEVSPDKFEEVKLGKKGGR